MTLTPSVRAMSLCSFPRVANSFACASFVAISALECLLFLTIAACIRPSPCCYKFSLRLGGTKRASSPCPDYKPAINMVNMRVWGYVIPRITWATTVANRAHCRRNPRGEEWKGQSRREPSERLDVRLLLPSVPSPGGGPTGMHRTRFQEKEKDRQKNRSRFHTSEMRASASLGFLS